jgi:hypothetical protein
MVLFNPTSSARLVANWLMAWNKMRTAGIPVFGAELLFPWQRDASLAPEFKTITVRSDSIMFHKEKLLMRLEREVPATYTKLCCIDCDIVFGRPDWYDAVSATLDERPVAQPFSFCYWLGPDLRGALAAHPAAGTQLGAIREAHARGNDRLSGYPGFAIAMRRGWRSSPIHFPWAVVGGGDAVIFRAVNGLVCEFANPEFRRMISPALADWSPAGRVDTDIGVVDGHIWHLWHGPMKGRQYYDRYVKFVEALGDIRVNDLRDLLVENTDGVWEWRADVKKALNTMMMRYFATRDDDSVMIG